MKQFENELIPPENAVDFLNLRKLGLCYRDAIKWKKARPINIWFSELENQRRIQRWAQTDLVIPVIKKKKESGNHLPYDAMALSYHLELGSPKRCGVWLHKNISKESYKLQFHESFSRARAELQCKDRITKTIAL